MAALTPTACRTISRTHEVISQCTRDMYTPATMARPGMRAASTHGGKPGHRPSPESGTHVHMLLDKSKHTAYTHP